MLQAIKSLLGELLSSKKFLVLVAGLLTVLAGRLGLDLDEETSNRIVAMIVAYLVGQGLADVGKSRARIDAETYGSAVSEVERE